MGIKEESIVELLQEVRGRTLPLNELCGRLGIGRQGRREIRQLLDSLVLSRKVERRGGNRFGIGLSSTPLSIGTLIPHQDGYGFVRLSAGDDIFIPARSMAGGLPGDQVEVQLVPGRRGGRSEGRIVRIVERVVKTVVGRFAGGERVGRLIPDDPRFTRDVIIPKAAFGGATDGLVVVVELTSWPDGKNPAVGKVVEVLGLPDDPEVEVKTIIAKYALPVDFTAACLAEAAQVPTTPGEGDRIDREDLRHLTTVTIDGETAKDFDDAVSVRQEGPAIRLWVSIADVSHYVLPGSALDQEAYLRGTSVYFPDRCLPMLPEALSNGICSLNPAVERLTLTAELLIDPNGGILESRFYPSMIRSAARLTYTQVRQVLVDNDPVVRDLLQPLIPDLEIMALLAERLTKKRHSRGSIDFDLPEAEIIIDLQGKTEDIVKAERNLAHRLIEEFMLAANEAVAAFVTEKKEPFLYRIHEHPSLEKLEPFREVVALLGHLLPMVDGRVLPADLQSLLAQVAGRPEERLVNEMLLRCMKQARYSETNVGHFGLASDCYTHFTSPIRRYPDLVVHRILKSLLLGKRSEKLSSALPAIAEHTSRRERVAMEAERELVALKKLQFMEEKIGEEFDGVISSVSPYGFYVELKEFFIEGMVHVASLSTDYYRFVEQQYALVGDLTGTVFRIGDQVRIQVAAVVMSRRQLDFALLSHSSSLKVGIADAGFRRQPIVGKKPAGWKGGGVFTKGGKGSGNKSGKGADTSSGKGKKNGGRSGGGKRRR